jgi:hypothetical protein
VNHRNSNAESATGGRNSPLHSRTRRASRSSRISNIEYRICLLILAAVFCESSCGVPAEPQPRRPIIPVAVADLAAHQRGDGGQLTFTAPTKDLEGEALAAAPNIEILRGFAPASAQSPGSGSLHLVYTLTGPALDDYRKAGRIEFQDAMQPEEVASHAGERMFYIVRARASKRAASDDSNPASFILHPVPAPLDEVYATVIESGVQLSWNPPAKISGGSPLTAPVVYRIYRSESPNSSPQKAEHAAPALAGTSSTPGFLDTQIEWGKTYQYTVCSVIEYGSESIESAESHAVDVTPKDVFPPAAPIELVGVYVRAAGATPAAVELSWAISPESDLAGYYVYRASENGEKAQRVTPSLLLTPAFRDISLTLGATYRYTVTAVDRSGNESQPSKPVSMKIPEAGE